MERAGDRAVAILRAERHNIAPRTWQIQKSHSCSLRANDPAKWLRKQVNLFLGFQGAISRYGGLPLTIP
jgi:hypothetical protein